VKFIRPEGVLSGIRVIGPHEEVPELIQFGEHWTPAGWEVQTHAHDYWEVYLQLKGESIWQSESMIYNLNPGQGYVVSPGVRHHSLTYSKGSQHFYYAELDVRSWCGEGSALRELHAFQLLDQARPLESVFRLLVSEAGLHPGSRQSWILHHLLGVLALQTDRFLSGAPIGPHPEIEPGTHPSLLQAQQLLKSNPDHPWRLEELGRMVGLSPQYLSSAFSQSFGRSPMRYLQSCRIDRAKELLISSDLTVTEIALESGFSSLQHFSARFREQTGLSPSEFRKKSMHAT